MFDAPFPSPCLQQSAAYARALTAIGVPVQRIDTGTAVANVIHRRVLGLRVNWLPRSPAIAPGTDLKQALADILQGGLWLVSSDGAEMDRALPRPALPLMTPQTVAHLALVPQGLDPAAMHGKWRNRLRAAERGPLSVRTERYGPRHWLDAAETAQRRARRYRALPLAFAHAWPDRRLFVAHDRGDPVAAMLFLLHGNAATYHIGWSGNDGRRLNAHHLILSHAARALAAEGIRSVELGPLDTDHAPGLARFKLGSGAKARRLGHGWLIARRNGWPFDL